MQYITILKESRIGQKNYIPKDFILHSEQPLMVPKNAVDTYEGILLFLSVEKITPVQEVKDFKFTFSLAEFVVGEFQSLEIFYYDQNGDFQNHRSYTAN